MRRAPGSVTTAQIVPILDRPLTKLPTAGYIVHCSSRFCLRKVRDGEGSHARSHSLAREFARADPAGGVRLVRPLGVAVVQRTQGRGDLRRPVGAVDPLTRRARAAPGRAMSTPGLFAVGVVVTLIVAVALIR